MSLTSDPRQIDGVSSHVDNMVSFHCVVDNIKKMNGQHLVGCPQLYTFLNISPSLFNNMEKVNVSEECVKLVGLIIALHVCIMCCSSSPPHFVETM